MIPMVWQMELRLIKKPIGAVLIAMIQSNSINRYYRIIIILGEFLLNISYSSLVKLSFYDVYISLTQASSRQKIARTETTAQNGY